MSTTHYYVSSEATNGYAVGDAGNDGLSKEAPFLTLDSVTTTAGSDVHIHLNGANVNCPDTKALAGTAIIEGEVDKTRIVNRSTTAGNYGLVVANSANVTFRHCVIGYGQCAVSALQFTCTTTLATVVLENVDVESSNYGMISSNNALLDITITNSRLVMVAPAATIGAGIYLTSLGDASAVAISGLVLDINVSAFANNVGAVQVSGAALRTATTCTIANVTGAITSAQTSNLFYGVSVFDIGGGIIEDCSLTINAVEAGTELFYGYRIAGTGLTATGCEIRNNRLRSNQAGGVMIIAGNDGASTQTISGTKVHGNHLYASSDNTGTHGILAGQNADCEVYNNIVEHAFIAFISKQSENHIFTHNVARFCGETAVAFQLKGADGAVFTGNLHLVEGEYYGKTFYLHVNVADYTNAAIIAGNARWVAPGATVGTNFVTVEADSDGTFYGNNWWVCPPGTFAATPFNYAGTNYSLADWNALDNVLCDTSFEFSGKHRTRLDHRLLSLVRGV